MFLASTIPWSMAISAGIFVGVLICLEAGYRWGNYVERKDENARKTARGFLDDRVPRLDSMSL